MKKQIVSFSILITSLFILFAVSCKKDDPDDNGSNNAGIPVLATSAVTDITQTTALSGGNITSDEGATVTVRGVCWSTGQTPTISDSKTTDGTGAGTFVSNISGLSPNTTYYARAYATNSNGTGYGSAMSFTTENGGGAGIPVLTTSAVTDITQTNASCGGNITSDGGATVTARGVCWSTGQTPTISDNITTDGTGAGTFVSNISGLSPNTTYYARAYATNSNGTGYGSAMSFTTEDGPIVVTLDNVDPNIQAYQTWTESGVILSLQEYNGGAYFGIATDGIYLAPCMLHANLSGLQGTITYVEVDIEANCGTGCTEAKLLDGGVEIAQAGNTLFGAATLHLSNPGGYMPDALTVSSLEGQVLEIRIFFSPPSANSFTDPRDGNVYQYVTIGSQVWMAENLKYLPSVVGPGTESNTTPYHYVFGYDGTSVSAAKATANYTTYGVLYNWPAAMNACPPGWHLPSDAEWTQLVDYLGGFDIAGGKLKETGFTHWNNPNTDATNETGFTALPGGFAQGGVFNYIGDYGFWWSATETNTVSAINRAMSYQNGTVGGDTWGKALGCSVRCVKD